MLGNYTEYDPVDYELGGKVVECVRSSASAVRAVKGPDRTFALIPFSLYHNVFGTPEEGKYSELASQLLNEAKSDSGTIDIIRDSAVFVVPNSGRFGLAKNAKVRVEGVKAYEYRERGGDISFLQNYAFFKLYEALKDVREDLEVYVDMTHGVNYTSFLVSDVVRALVQALVVSASSPPDLKGGLRLP